ncbi:MAG: hypothetical protein LBI63_05250 [Candidatus Ancillula sp.]|nr:hypothetical protein [Candidatus Ancillula sp.]
MSRKNLYDIVEEQVVSADELWQQIYGLYTRELTLKHPNYRSTIKNSFEGLFNNQFMKSGRMNSLRIKFNRSYSNFFHNLLNETFETTNRSSGLIVFNPSRGPTGTFDTIYTFAELLHFIFPSTNKWIDDFESGYKKNDDEYEFYENLNEISKIIEYALNISNHKIEQVNDKFLVIEDRPEVTQVVSIVAQDNTDLALKLLEYNHFSNGIDDKRDILKLMAISIETIIKSNKQLNGQLKTDYGYLANDFLDIRHPQKVSHFADTQLEEWYDRLYGIIIAIIIDVDYKVIHKEIERVKKSNLSGGTK